MARLDAGDASIVIEGGRSNEQHMVKLAEGRITDVRECEMSEIMDIHSFLQLLGTWILSFCCRK
jgi:hypothetical protein